MGKLVGMTDGAWLGDTEGVSVGPGNRHEATIGKVHLGDAAAKPRKRGSALSSCTDFGRETRTGFDSG